ncbi:beta-lactamase [Exophiala viscosa]|uniref:beta-lactamase n=1 Tax=Exophiala viscosa TaxID=2486360 RepID=UPI00218FFC65|nr:beta-lactamase [Exophiala viscosa]
MAASTRHLEVYTQSSSEKGLSSVTTLIVGSKAAVIIDPPFLVPDAKAVVEMAKSKTSKPVVAVFVTHHHPDHYFSANPILEAWPKAKFLAHPYVRAGIDREYDEKVIYWPQVFGRESVPVNPRRPEVYNYSFFILEGDEASPIALLGPVQGDSVDHTLFWMPRERIIVTGDAVYARTTHAWVEEIETPDILHAWNLTLQLIEALDPVKIITGHIESGADFDKEKDLEHMHQYLGLFEEKITNAKEKPQVQDLFDAFKTAFPHCTKNLDFFLGHLSNQFGEGGQKWEENRQHDVASRTRDSLEGFLLGTGASK